MKIGDRVKATPAAHMGPNAYGTIVKVHVNANSFDVQMAHPNHGRTCWFMAHELEPATSVTTWERLVREIITDPAVAERILSIPHNATLDEARAILGRAP